MPRAWFKATAVRSEPPSLPAFYVPVKDALWWGDGIGQPLGWGSPSIVLHLVSFYLVLHWREVPAESVAVWAELPRVGLWGLSLPTCDCEQPSGLKLHVSWRMVIHQLGECLKDRPVWKTGQFESSKQDSTRSIFVSSKHLVWSWFSMSWQSWCSPALRWAGCAGAAAGAELVAELPLARCCWGQAAGCTDLVGGELEPKGLTSSSSFCPRTKANFEKVSLKCNFQNFFFSCHCNLHISQFRPQCTEKGAVEQPAAALCCPATRG